MSLIALALSATVAGAAPTLTINGDCPGPMTVAITGATGSGKVALAVSDASGTTVIPSGRCAGQRLDLDQGSVSLLVTPTTNGAGSVALNPTVPAAQCGRRLQVVDLTTCQVSNAGCLGDYDGDGLCDREDPCPADVDGDGICDDIELCIGDDAYGDTDGDGWCDDVDVCDGDDAYGDTDGDGVCDDLDACTGDDASGDTDGDGVCDDLDVCDGDDAYGDTDGDGVCDDLDLCDGDDAYGDADADGICADLDICDDRYNPGQEDFCNAIFVDARATGAGDGSTWADAFTHPADAAAAASAGDELWVAVGTYVPSAANSPVVALGVGVSMYGGFEGTELERADRAGRFVETILDGDFNGDDDKADRDTWTDNSKPVLNVGDNSVVDGLVIAHGYTSGGTVGAYGAGIKLNQDQGVVIQNVIVRDNYALGSYGAGLGAVQSSEVTVRDAVFMRNGSNSRAVDVASTTGGRVTLVNVTFMDSDGGPALVSGSQNAMINCSVYDDTSSGASVETAIPIMNTVFYGSATPLDTGAAFTISHTAAPIDLSAFSATNVFLDDSTAELGDPFVVAASGQLYLNHTAAGQASTSAAVDAGDDATADVDFPEWTAMSTRTDGVLDTTPVDMGAHQAPDAPAILTLEDDGYAVTWTTLNTDACDLSDNGVVTMNATSGLAGSGGPYVLTCYGTSGGSARAEL